MVYLNNFIRRYTSPLYAIIVVEIVGAIFVTAGILPREAALFLAGVYIFFVLFAPLKQAVLFAVFSIPFYIALPISESFDMMAGWRMIVAILFLRAFWGSSLLLSSSFSAAQPRTKQNAASIRGFVRGQRRPPRLGLFCPFGDHAKTALKSAIKQYRRTPFARLGILVSIFFVLGILSLFVAPEPIFGIKKLIYFANIFALFFIIKAVIKNKEDFSDLLKYTFAGSLAALTVGYAQFLTVLFVPLYTFWQWWANNVIPVFYGEALGDLLSYSNTWFSYYENAGATLRMFSLFPDSHSFALFMVLSLPIAFTFLVIKKGKSVKIFSGTAIFFILLAIILSGTRGVWVGAVPVFLLLIIFFALFFVLRQFRVGPRIFQSFAGKILGSGPSSASVPRIRSIFLLAIASLVIFALLFPISSQLLKFSQMRQGGKVSQTSFERISSSLSTQEHSNKGRIQIWESTFTSIARYPFLGVGIGNYPVVLGENISATKEGASAHSLYLDIIAEMGIFAGIILLLIFLEILWRALMVFARSKDIALQLFAGFFAIYFIWVVVYSAVDVVLLNDKALLLFTVLVALLYAGFNKHSSEERGK